jgi:type IV pilus assembly protein PilN
MIRINLLPVKISKRQEAVRRELIALAVGATIILVGLGGAQAALSSDVSALKQQNRVMSQEIEQKKAFVLEVDETEKLEAETTKKLNVIKRLKAKKVGPVHMLDQLSQACPEKLQITELKERDNRVLLTGVAVGNEVISQFLSNLEKSEYFADVYLNAIDQVDVNEVKLKEFSISSRLVVTGVSVEPTDEQER